MRFLTRFQNFYKRGFVNITGLRHVCGYVLANKGHDTRAVLGWLGHRSITSTSVYTALAPNRFKDFWRD